MKEISSQFAFYSRFLIPRGPGESGVCLASIVDTYLNALANDRVDTPGNSPLIRTGRNAVSNKPSVFVNSPIGVNYLYDVGKDVAKFLHLAEPNRYTGHCFRRTSATELANSGATVMEMKQKFHWTNDKMPLVYVANSDANQCKMAKLLTGVDVNANSGPSKEVELFNESADGEESSEPPAKRIKPEDGIVALEGPKAEEKPPSNPTSSISDFEIFSGNSKFENCTVNVTFKNS